MDAEPALYDEVEQALKEVEALERTVESKSRTVESITGGGHSGSYYSGRGRTKDVTQSRRRRSEQRLLADYRVQLRKKQGEAKRLQQQLEEPRQIIHGHWGQKIIMLQTTKDLSRRLDKMELGDQLSWRGRRLRQDNSGEEWVVLSIQKVESEVDEGTGG